MQFITSDELKNVSISFQCSSNHHVFPLSRNHPCTCEMRLKGSVFTHVCGAAFTNNYQKMGTHKNRFVFFFGSSLTVSTSNNLVRHRLDWRESEIHDQQKPLIQSDTGASRNVWLTSDECSLLKILAPADCMLLLSLRAVTDERWA